MLSYEVLFFKDRTTDSGVWRRKAPKEADVHAIGCDIAKSANANQSKKRLKQGLSEETIPGEDRKYYCGFREASKALLEVRTDRFSVKITHLPEGGLDAHVEIKLTVNAGVQKAVAMIEASMAMSRVLGGPFAHTCAGDAGDQKHPLVLVGPACLAPSA